MGKVRLTYLRLLLSVVMMVLFSGYVASISLFTHVHQIDGEVVAHSHPYSGSSELPGHSHTKQQLSTIAMLSIFVAEAAETPVFHFAEHFTLRKLLCFVKTKAEYLNSTSCSLRAPPVYTI